MAISGGEGVAAALDPHLWLVNYHGKGYEKQFLCSPLAGRSPVKTFIPVLGSKKVLSCAHGCLVLYDYNAKSLSLCNSTTLEETLILPDLRHLSNYKIDSCVLQPPGSWPNFTVLIFLEKLPSILFCRVGETEWREIRYEKYLKQLIPHAPDFRSHMFFRRAVGFRGKIYAQLGRQRTIKFFYSMISIEIVEEESGSAEFGLVLCTLKEPTGWSSGLFPIYDNAYMLESCEELFFLYFSDGAQVFEVYRMNFDTMTWERTKSINGTAFFIGKSHSMSWPTSGPGRVYFRRRKDDRLYCYYMEDDSVLMFSPRSELPTSCVSLPVWMNSQFFLSIKVENQHADESWNINHHKRRSTVMSKLELSENENVHNIQLCDLPYDLLGFVSKNIKALDYMNFRAMNKMCRTICPPINWRMTLSRAARSYCFPSPLLMFPDAHEGVYRFVNPSINSKSNNYYFMRMSDSLESHTIFYSDEGWVLLYKSGSCFTLYNPFTRNKITYNCMNISREKSLFFIGKPPGSNIPIHVSFFYGTNVTVSTQIHHDGDWTRDALMSQNSFDAAMQTSPVLFKDAFYFLDKTGVLGKLKIDFEEGDMMWEALEKPQRPGLIKSFDHNFLVECGGELISVYLGRAGKWVSVYRLNKDDEVWEKVSDLGGYDLYLNATSSVAVLSLSGGNRIYFPLLRGCDVVFFSMKTSKWHFSGSQHDSSTHLYGTKWYPNSCWIKPEW